MKKASLRNQAFSLIETLVVVALFSVIAVVVAQSTAVSLTGSRKSDASSKVRENLNSAMNVVERQLRSSRGITSACTGVAAQRIDYFDQDGVSTFFRCNPNVNCNSGTTTYVASGSARLTSTDSICITSCQFVCTPSTNNLPPTVEINLTGQSKNTTGVENTAVQIRTSVTVRAY